MNSNVYKYTLHIHQNKTMWLGTSQYGDKQVIKINVHEFENVDINVYFEFKLELHK
jgi:hypothetical protein